LWIRVLEKELERHVISLQECLEEHAKQMVLGRWFVVWSASALQDLAVNLA